MKRYQFTPEAEDDLFQIWLHIAHDSVDAAERVEAEILKACTFLGEAPLCGHERKDLTTLPLRFWTLPRFCNYTIVYDAAKKPLAIVRLFTVRAI